MPNTETKTFTPTEIRALISDLRQEHGISARKWGEGDPSKISTAASRGADALEYLLQFVEWWDKYLREGQPFPSPPTSAPKH